MKPITTDTHAYAHTTFTPIPLFAEHAIHSEALDLLTATPKELTCELSQRVMKRLDERLKGTSDADPVRLGIQGYRARLYEQRFGAIPGMCQACMMQLK